MGYSGYHPSLWGGDDEHVGALAYHLSKNYRDHPPELKKLAVDVPKKPVYMEKDFETKHYTHSVVDEPVKAKDAKKEKPAVKKKTKKT